MESISYYNNHAHYFYQNSINSDLSYSHERFLKYLCKSSTILDAGCGVGRDIRFFMQNGYKVTAFDASEKMVEYANNISDINVLKLCFENMCFNNEFDGVWASASLLHLPYNKTLDVYQKIHCSLKSQGIFYGSYLYGNDKILVGDNRHFYNMTELSILPYLNGLFDLVEHWKSPVKNNNSQAKSKTWLNFIVRKKL